MWPMMYLSMTPRPVSVTHVPKDAERLRARCCEPLTDCACVVARVHFDLYLAPLRLRRRPAHLGRSPYAHGLPGPQGLHLDDMGAYLGDGPLPLGWRRVQLGIRDAVERVHKRALGRLQPRCHLFHTCLWHLLCSFKSWCRFGLQEYQNAAWIVLRPYRLGQADLDDTARTVPAPGGVGPGSPAYDEY